MVQLRSEAMIPPHQTFASRACVVRDRVSAAQQRVMPTTPPVGLHAPAVLYLSPISELLWLGAEMIKLM